MLKLDNTLLDELGLGSLPEEQKKAMLQHIYETLELRVGTNLANQMSDQQLEEFEKFIDDGGDANQAQALQWLEANLPNYKQVVNDVFEALKGEIRQMAPQIVASSGAAPQAPVAAPAAPQPLAPPQYAAPDYGQPVGPAPIPLGEQQATPALSPAPSTQSSAVANADLWSPFNQLVTELGDQLPPLQLQSVRAYASAGEPEMALSGLVSNLHASKVQLSPDQLQRLHKLAVDWGQEKELAGMYWNDPSQSQFPSTPAALPQDPMQQFAGMSPVAPVNDYQAPAPVQPQTSADMSQPQMPSALPQTPPAQLPTDQPQPQQDAQIYQFPQQQPPAGPGNYPTQNAA